MGGDASTAKGCLINETICSLLNHDFLLESSHKYETYFLQDNTTKYFPATIHYYY